MSTSTTPPTKGRGISRRSFLGATAGLAGAAAAITVLPSTAFADNGVTVEPGKRGIQLFTVRDVVGRAPNAATGVNGGFRYVFEQLRGMGYTQVEFAGYTQSTSILGRQITPAEIRQLMDDNGLQANGSHIGFSDAAIEAQLDVAGTLGMPHASRERRGRAPPPPNSRSQAPTQRERSGLRLEGRGRMRRRRCAAHRTAPRRRGMRQAVQSPSGGAS